MDRRSHSKAVRPPSLNVSYLVSVTDFEAVRQRPEQ